MILPETELHPTASRPTHAVDILAFVEAQEIPPDYFETPYTLSPAPGGEKAYALLRETLRRTRRIGIAYVVIRARRHLAALVPQGQSLVLNTLRWTSEAGDADFFGLPEEDAMEARELAMMSPRWDDAGTASWDLDWHRQSYERDFNTLAQHSDKLDNRPAIVVEELDAFSDDEDDIDFDDYLCYTLRQRRHLADGHAARRARGGHWRTRR
ncbi:MAG TPA: Ku protein [Noviherbaspirillum sp.]|uniref:Ku protein n=1 Tax=Noviherbaspirillum sp. TaxID=1926288 RepID=UPI002F92FB5D